MSEIEVGDEVYFIQGCSEPDKCWSLLKIADIYLVYGYVFDIDDDKLMVNVCGYRFSAHKSFFYLSHKDCIDAFKKRFDEL